MDTCPCYTARQMQVQHIDLSNVQQLRRVTQDLPQAIVLSAKGMGHHSQADTEGPVLLPSQFAREPKVTGHLHTEHCLPPWVLARH